MVLASTADEIEVLVAAFAGAWHEDKTTFAATAPRGAFEVVVVCTFAGVTPGRPGLSGPGREFLVDDGFVPALMFGAFVGDVAEVIAVAEHLPDLVDGDVSPCRMAFSGFHPQAGIGERVGDILFAVGTSGEQLKAHPDERSTLGVDGDNADLAFFEFLADVAVPDQVS